MAINPSDVDSSFPVAIAGVRSMRCECGWEITLLIPEELDRGLVALMQHIQILHGIILPHVLVQEH